MLGETIWKNLPSILHFASGALALSVLAPVALAARDGGREAPLRVMLIPADGGTEDGTRADYEPVFRTIERETGLRFDIRVGQSYGSVIEGLTSHLADIAFLGPVAYVAARERGAAELLAVGVENGSSVYYAGIFVNGDSGIETLADLKGKRVAFGDMNSASSFTFQMAMMLEEGMNPVRDLAAIRLTGSHANAIAALVQGYVDAACLSFDSYERAVRAGTVDARSIRVLARSEPIPYPPLAMHPDLPESLKAKLREAFGNVHNAPGMRADSLRGYAGKRIDRYDADFPEAAFTRSVDSLAAVDDEMRAAILRRAAERQP